jgi:hypothetical protein
LIKADQRAVNFQFKEPVWFYYVALVLWLLAMFIAWRSDSTGDVPGLTSVAIASVP